MPAPTMPPITIMVASNRLSLRASATSDIGASFYPGAVGEYVVAMRTRLALALCLILGAILGLALGVPLTVSLFAQSAAPFNDSIRISDLKADLFFLAGDGFKGRLVGTPENALAAEFVRSRFERAGLKPGAPNGSFVQTNNLMIATLGTGNRLEVASPDGTRLDLRSEQDFYPQRFSASGSVKAPVDLCGLRHPRAEAGLRRLRRPREGPHRAHPGARAGGT